MFGYRKIPEKSKWILKPTKAKAVHRPKYRLEVLSDENSIANVVNIGKKGHLLVTLIKNSKEQEESNFSITNLTAEDKTSNKNCVVNNSVIRAISKPTRGQMKIDVEFSGFDDKAQVVYHAVIKKCKTGCFPKCNQAYYIGISQ